MDEKTNEIKHGIRLLSDILDTLENGDCIEDFPNSHMMAHYITTMTILVRHWLDAMKWQLHVENHGGVLEAMSAHFNIMRIGEEEE